MKFRRIEPMNQDANASPKRWNQFSLSPGERAGVRVSVKQFTPRAGICFAPIITSVSHRRFIGRQNASPTKRHE